MRWPFLRGWGREFSSLIGKQKFTYSGVTHFADNYSKIYEVEQNALSRGRSPNATERSEVFRRKGKAFTSLQISLPDY